jgi:hypothetical protein
MTEPVSPHIPARRHIIFAALALIVFVGVALYVWVHHRERFAPASKTSTESAKAISPLMLQALRTEPHVFVRSAKRAEFGRVAIARLATLQSERFVTDLHCERFAFAGDRGVCVLDNRIHLTPPAKAQIVDEQLRVLHTVDLAGIPSRARVSADGRYAAATVFTSGDDYESEFSTRTTLIDARTGRVIADLEQFEVRREGRVIREVDFNFWGVTFKADSNLFFATLGSKGKTHLVEGNVEMRTFKVVRDDVECPSLSPNQRVLVFKSRDTATRGWRLHALELGSGSEWPLLSETRSVDDQVEWLDDDHVLYRILEERGTPEQALSVWSIPIAHGATEAPRLFLRAASSPSVQRQ